MAGAWRLRGYVVERLIGRGASGEVWRARVASTGEPVALKRMNRRDDEPGRPAATEAALLTALDHPHLVRLHALVTAADGADVLVLDLADGGSLAQLLAVRGRLTPGEVITAVAPIAAALAYLHDQGVVHGDVSAANILFTPGGSPLLADVGVARLTGDDTDAASPPAYVDPSVAAGCVPGPPSDVFMLAGVALHALTGAPPWDADSGTAALALAAQGRLDDVTQRLAAADVPPAMAAVLGRALTVDPQRRGTAADLALDLRHSGEPLAVELAAGRGRVSPADDSAPPLPPPPLPGPRHAARPGAPRRSADAAPGADQRSRPAFERPSSAAGPAGSPPPTRLAGPRPRPVIPRPPPRGLRRRAVVLALVLACAGLLAAAGAVWASTSGRPPSRGAAARTATPTRATVGPGRPVTTGRSTSISAPRPNATSSPQRRVSTVRRPASTGRSSPVPMPTATSISDVHDWRAALSALDALRARAFLTRDPHLLAGVYVPGPLLVADIALLRRIVPDGCGLSGVRTRYANLRGAVHGDRVTVTATATLASSHLVCGGRVSGTAPGAGPDQLRLVLVTTAAGVRIAELRA